MEGNNKERESCSVASDSLGPYERYSPWNYPGKNTGAGCHFLLQGDLPNPGIKLKSPVSPALAGGIVTGCVTGDAHLF